MIAAWASKAITPLIIVAAMLTAAAFLGWLTLSTVHSMVETGRKETAAERDAYWTGRIEKANGLAATADAKQVREVLRIEKEATDRLAAVTQQQANLEKENAALPNGDACGLGRDRVRLLPH
ncbi:hypothetical protein RHIZ_02940 [Rhizobium skierniewicense]|uniref:hypothetical protein n=1 Tax=Rhizobium skierniewicense TaxID=984260 RepID=UPI001FACE697|nr:hypothetical protein [Rhizobium skierniewicense]MCI9864897.1 hypothetical protein [Rhizobium skierniewicense]